MKKRIPYAHALRTAAVVCMFLIFPLPLFLGSCSTEKTLVVYTAVDQVFSEPLFKQFSEQTGIKVLPVYDVEAAKTTGIVNRLIAEKGKPQADVFWSNEFIQTILLQENGVLAPYFSSYAKDIPASFKESNGYWTGFGGRARILLVNKEMVASEQYPTSLLTLMDAPVDPKLIGIALPMFGTTATHAAALYAELGRDKALAWYKNAKDKGIQAVDGNSVVRDRVVSGQMAMGLTDTDDAYGAVNDGAPVEVVYLDQGEGEMGTLINPNTVALIAGAPHTAIGKQFVDWLLRPETEAILLNAGWIDLPCRDVGVKSKNLGDRVVKGMSVNLADIYKELEVSKSDLTALFVQ